MGQTLTPQPGVTDTGNQRSTASADIQSTSVNKLKDLLQVPAETDSRHRAAESVISRWVSRPKVDTGYSAVDNDDIYFELVSRLNGLRSLQVDKDLTLIQRLNLPAVLKMIEPERKTPVYLVVCKAGSNSFAVARGKHQPCLSVSFQELKTCWSGTAYVLWKNFYHYQATIPLDSNEDSVVTLKMHLRDLGFEGLSTNGDYDLPTRRAVKTIQAGQGIPVDGFVGPLTQIVLYNQNQALPIPHLNSVPETGPAG